LIRQADLPERLRSQSVTAWLGPKMHAVQYPVRGGEWLNIVAFVHGDVPSDFENWDHTANAADLGIHLTDGCPQLQDMVNAAPAWRLWVMHDRPPIHGPYQMAQGRVALLGDAAHPMRPYLAQGAGMAIEDAAELGMVLKQAAPQNVLTSLQQYAEHRWQRNARVQARALRNGQIFHATGPVRWGRDAAMRLLGERLLDMPWLYGTGTALM
jgi:salicylate hydroxylase